jgi:hypothetical protein
MLIIRREQMALFESAVEDEFERRLTAAIRAWHGAELHQVSDDALRARVRAGIARARGYGFRYESTIADFVELRFSVGERFDEHPPVRTVLTDRCLPLEQRVKWLIEHLPGEDWVGARRAGGGG